VADPISKSTVQVAIWPGLISNGGPIMSGERPGSASEQVNLQVNVPGQMQVRAGVRKAQFDEET
jgi:hypothetical protein